MWWECSECGGRVEAAQHPEECEACGVDGAVFVRLGTCAHGGQEIPPRAESWLLAGLCGELPQWAGAEGS